MIGIDRVVDEFIFKFTHDAVIDWLYAIQPHIWVILTNSSRLPGVPPTFKKAQIPFTAVVNIRGDRLYHEHISWDQGTVLVQLGLIPEYLPYPYAIKDQETGAKFEYRVPVTGIDTAKKMLDRNSVESNQMMGYEVRKST